MGCINSSPVDEYELNHKDSVVFKLSHLSLSQQSSTVSAISDKNRGSTSSNSQVQLINTNNVHRLSQSTVTSPPTSEDTSPKHFQHNSNSKNKNETNKKNENSSVLSKAAYKWERRSSDSILKEMSSLDDDYKSLEKQKSKGQLGLPSNSRMNSASLSFLQPKPATPRKTSLSSFLDTSRIQSADVFTIQQKLDQVWNETQEPKRTFSDVSILSTASKADDFISPPISRKNSRLNLNLMDRRDSLDDSLILWPHERVQYENKVEPLRLVSFDVDKGKLDSINEKNNNKNKTKAKINKQKSKNEKKKKIKTNQPKIHRKRSLSVDHTPYGNDISSVENNNDKTNNGSKTARVSRKSHKRSSSIKLHNSGRFNSTRSSSTRFKHVKSVIDTNNNSRRGRKKSKKKK